MKIFLSANQNHLEIIRRCGYGLIRDGRRGQVSFVRRLGRDFYPRFHLYLEKGQLNLHLDQKRPSYQGVAAHSGEYQGEVVEREAARIRQIIDYLSRENLSAKNKNANQKSINRRRGFLARLFKRK